jgi:hypothetical protein
MKPKKEWWRKAPPFFFFGKNHSHMAVIFSIYCFDLLRG